MLMDSIQYISGADHNYDVTGSTLATPIDDSTVMRFRAVRAFKIPVNLTGCEFFAEVPPSTGNATFSIQKNDVTVGTLVFAQGANTATVTFGSEVAIAVGDRVEVIATACNGIDEVYFTFKTLAA